MSGITQVALSCLVELSSGEGKSKTQVMDIVARNGGRVQLVTWSESTDRKEERFIVKFYPDEPKTSQRLKITFSLIHKLNDLSVPGISYQIIGSRGE